MTSATRPSTSLQEKHPDDHTQIQNDPHVRRKPGIRLAIALRAAADGANIALIAKTDTPHPALPGTIHTAAAEIERAGGQALPIVGDIRDDACVERAVEQTVARFGASTSS